MTENTYPCGTPKKEKAERKDFGMHDGFQDGFEPLVSLDLDKATDLMNLSRACLKQHLVDVL